MFWVCPQEANGARYAATVKSVRQVKTVFVIFIAFVCCWSPYIVVLLYDNSDSLPLPVHLYVSMLAHLHASLNFAIYGLSNRARYLRYVTRCLRRMTPGDRASNVLYFTSEIRHTTGRECVREVDVDRMLVNVERHQSPQSESCHDAVTIKTSNVRRPPVHFSTFSTEEEHLVVTP